MISKQNRTLLGSDFLFAFILPAGGHAASDVPLPAVQVQHDPHLPVERWIAVGQTLAQVLVHRGFGNAEMLRRGPYGGPGVDDVHSQLPGPVIHIVRHQIPLRCCVLGKGYAAMALDRTAPWT